jgi:hypothetical protein
MRSSLSPRRQVEPYDMDEVVRQEQFPGWTEAALDQVIREAQEEPGEDLDGETIMQALIAKARAAVDSTPR